MTEYIFRTVPGCLVLVQRHIVRPSRTVRASHLCLLIPARPALTLPSFLRSSSSSSRLPCTNVAAFSTPLHASHFPLFGPSLTNIDLLPSNLLASPNSPSYRGPFLPRPFYFIHSLPPSSRPFPSTPPRPPPPAHPLPTPASPSPHQLTHLTSLRSITYSAFQAPPPSACAACCALRRVLSVLWAVGCLLCVVYCVQTLHCYLAAQICDSLSTNTRQRSICPSWCQTPPPPRRRHRRRRRRPRRDEATTALDLSLSGPSSLRELVQQQSGTDAR